MPIIVFLFFFASALQAALFADTLFLPQTKPAGNYTLMQTTSRPVLLPREEEHTIAPVRISFAGDVMLDRYIRKTSEPDGYTRILRDTVSLFGKSDLIVTNLEGPITHYATKSIGTKNGDEGHYTFTFAPESRSTFFGSPSRWLFTLGNNHILNFGNEGLRETKNYLREGGFSFFGAPDEAYTPLIKEIEGMRFAFIGFNEFAAQDTSMTVAAIRGAAEKSDAVVVFAHWGAEYETFPTEAQYALAHSFVDAGAKLVIGAHAHVVARKEVYRGAPIYYSLGNFVFDQYFSPEVHCGAVVHATFSRERDVFTMEEDFISLEKDGTTQASDCMSAVPLLE